MKILHVSMKHDYGDELRPYSYEYMHFYGSLLASGHEVYFFDFMQQAKNIGKKAMNSLLLKTAMEFNPDITLISLYQDEFEFETFEQLNKTTKTLCFFHDDTWRIDFTRTWAPCFNYFTSPDFECIYKYPEIGLKNILHFPFGVNESIFNNLHIEKIYDVSFVGQWHPYREWLIRRIQKSGIQVKVAGHGWPSGSISQEEMVKIFNQSKINLNLSNSTSWDARFLIQHPRALINTIRSPKSVEQLKGRHFEIPACGGFQLSYYVDGLDRYYTIGEEIAIFINPDDLVRKINYFIEQKDRAEDMAKRAYARTLKEHTYRTRFQKIFDQVINIK